MSHATHPVLPWWRVKVIWLAIGGPVAVVLAGIVTTVIAVQGADTVVRAPTAATTAASQMPAQQARNHAATVQAPEPQVR
jgi:hypothetical protein